MQAPVWETKSKEALKAFIKKNSKVLLGLQQREAVEANVRTFVADMLVEGFGFDKFEELTSEYLVKGEFADIAIRFEKQIKAFVEIKRISTVLKEQHLRQVTTYAANEGVEWAILTNGRVWEVYHISNSTPLTQTLMFSVDLLSEQTPSQKVSKLWQLSRDAMKRDVLSDEWKTISALKSEVISKALHSDEVLRVVRTQIKKSTGELVNPEKLKEAISTLIRF